MLVKDRRALTPATSSGGQFRGSINSMAGVAEEETIDPAVVGMPTIRILLNG